MLNRASTTDMSDSTLSELAVARSLTTAWAERAYSRAVRHQTCKSCTSSVPIFRLRDEDGHAEVVTAEVPKELEEKARKAMRGCPEQAISIEE